ncbi:MAG: hypothetical protein KUG79_00155 [Pseudomonadales bacterium]|nr:hypothetical protein [Pseudomonadales bacterium]
MNNLLVALVILACASIASADSITVSLKPSKGLSGTASLNLHEDGKVTLLMYKSPVNIEENLIEVTELQLAELRAVVLKALNSYLTKTDYKAIELHDFSVSFLHTKNQVSKNITSKRLTETAKLALRKIFAVVPEMKLGYLDGDI